MSSIRVNSIRARRLRSPWAVCLGTLFVCTWTLTRPTADAQEAVGQPAAPPEKLGLDRCIELGLQNQPALAAARASLNAASSGEQALSNMRFVGLIKRDMSIRREQACLGVNIASAGQTQAEFETRYAVQRMFYSVQYARMQAAVVDSAVGKIERAHKQALKLVDLGDPKLKVTKIDADTLELNLLFIKTKQTEATNGMIKALAGLREAIGVGRDYPRLDLTDEPLPSVVSNLDIHEMLRLAQANRAELQQAYTMNRITELEIAAQRRNWFGLQVPTFAAAGDIHAKPIPQGEANGEYRPGAIGPEMPVFLIGRHSDRTQRAGDFNDRAGAVVNKTENLIALEVEITYLKWQEESQNIAILKDTDKKAEAIEANVRKRFDDGNATGEEYLRARTLVDQAKAMYNQALYEHALALAALERVTAGGYRVPSGK